MAKVFLSLFAGTLLDLLLAEAEVEADLAAGLLSTSSSARPAQHTVVELCFSFTFMTFTSFTDMIALKLYIYGKPLPPSL